MKYYDRVYGEFEITEPVILELINSPSLQRLKDVDQYGYKPLWVKPEVFVGEYDYSRFAHSIGVYLLLRKYGAPLEEQIAGLIHDVSHSTFSHCIDYVLDSGSEKEHSHQDNIFDNFVRKTEIPEIIKKHGFDLEYILNDKNFLLKEKKLPDLCADRIDYCLRDATIFEEINNKEKNFILENLTTQNDYWVFKNFKSAKKYAELFLKMNTKYYTMFPTAVMFRVVGDYIKYALQKGYISKDDLYTTDKAVLEKIKKFLGKDERLNLLWQRMNNKVSPLPRFIGGGRKVTNNPHNFDVSVFCKSRIVDPLFKHNRILKRLSEVEPAWKNIIKQELKPKQYFLKFDNLSTS